MQIEKLKERIRNVIEYWNEDESLLYNECVEALVNVFRDYVYSLVPKERDEINSPFSNRNLTFVDGWNKCREKILKRIEEG